MKEREKCKKPAADGVWGSDSRGCRPGEPFVLGQMCLCARRVCACVEYASACDASLVLRVRSSLFTRAPSGHLPRTVQHIISDKR